MSRLLAIAIVFGLGVVADMSGPHAQRYGEPPDYDRPMPGEECQSVLEDYQSQVADCLAKASTLEEARTCSDM